MRAALLASSALIAAPAAAQDAAWNAAPDSADFNTATNWTPATVPTGVASFGSSTIASLTFSGSRNVDDFQFNGGAPAYTFTLATPFTIRLNGNGIVNNSANAPTFKLNVGGTLEFDNASTAANAKIEMFDGILNFKGASKAGTAVITMANDMHPGHVTFSGTSSADNANITNNSVFTLGGVLLFLEGSTAGNATIVNNPNSALPGDGGTLVFGDPTFSSGTHTSNAGTANITNNQFGSTSFLSQTSAMNATITNNAGGTTNFQDESTAANAIIDVKGGGNVSFFDSSTGGSAKFITETGGTFDMSGLTSGGMTAGSIEGGGSYMLGANALTVGSLNLSTEVSGVISGNGGSLTKVGTGTLTLSGANTYDGGTTVSGGTVIAKHATAGTIDALGTGNVLLDGATLKFGVSGTVNNGITFNDNKTSILSAGTQTVSLDGGVALGPNATAQFGAAGDTGTLVLNSSPSADTTNKVVVAGGTLKDSGNSIVGLTFFASTQVDAGATLDFNDSSNQAIRNLTGAGNVITGVLPGAPLTLYADDNTSSTWAGTISGVRHVNILSYTSSDGTMIFTGANTYTGGTTVCACSTLQLGTLAAAGSIIKDVTVEGTFNVVNSNTAGITSITNDGGTTQFFNGTSASAAIIVNKNNGVLNFFNTSTAGTADITNRDGGITTFSNSSTAGNATITNRVTGGETNFLNSSNAGHAIIVNNGGLTTFVDQSSAANADITNRAFGATIFGTIGGTDTASAGNATITNRETGGETIFQALTTAGTATIVNNGGTTSFFEMSNAGAAIITNRNGGQTVFGDQSSAADATIVNRNGFFFAPSQTVFFGDSTAANASITNQSFGVTLFVDNATAGNATITNNADGVTVFGTPQFTDAPSAGTARITTNDGGQALFQAFSTAGSAIITTNSGGVTAFFDNATGGNAQFITNAGGTVDLSQTLGPGGNKKITAGSIAGAGDYFLGGIELTVGGNNLSTIVSGTINDGLSPFTCGCGIPGSGASLVKVGTGTLTLSGVNTYTGPTVVNAGTLSVNGSIVSSSGVTVNTGGTLGGTGTLPKTTIHGGTLSPGNSIGTISVNGSLSFVGPGNYIVEVSPSAADKTNVTGAPGTASLAGTLSAVGLGGSYTVGTKYTVLNATGGVSGTFGSLAISGSFGITKPHIEYDANNVYLVLDPNALPLTGLTRNERSVATAVNTAVTAGSQSAPFLALFNLTAAQLPGALDQLSGEVHASTAGVLLDESLYPRSAVLGRLRQASYGGDGQMASLSMGGPQAFAGGEELSALAYGKSPIVTKAPPMVSQPGYDVVFWAQGFGARGKFDTDGNATDLRRDLAGFFSGADTRVGSDGRLGIAAGYTASRNNLDGRGSANVETGHLMGYGGWRFGALSLRGGAAYAWHSIDTDRTIAFPGFFDRATAHYNGGTGQIFGEAGYGFAFGKVAVEPFAGAALVHLKTDAFNERGGAAALGVAANAFEVGYSTLGIRAASMIPLAADMMLVPRVAVAWQHAFTDVTPTAVLAFVAAPVPFVVAGVPIARDSLLAEAGLDLAIGRSATLGLSYVGQLARNVQDHAAKGKFSWKF